MYMARLPDIWNKINDTALKEKLAAATDPAVISEIKNQMMYLNASRVLLVGIFVSVSYMVYIAYRKRTKEGRATG